MQSSTGNGMVTLAEGDSRVNDVLVTRFRKSNVKWLLGLAVVSVFWTVGHIRLQRTLFDLLPDHGIALFVPLDPNVSSHYSTSDDSKGEGASISLSACPSGSNVSVHSINQTTTDEASRIGTIPAYKWPQFDDSVSRTIREGLRIGVQHQSNSTFYEWNGTRYESPVQNLSTIVTAYYHIASKHPAQQYQDWFSFLLQATDPMIIFVDPTSPWVPQFVIERRRHAPTIVARLAFANLTMGTTFHDDFWKKEALPRDGAQCPRKGVNVYKIWNQKIILMQQAAQVNPFHTQHFVWMDAGYFRRPRGERRKHSPIVRNNMTANRVGKHQLLMQNIFRDPSRYMIAAGAWGGTRAAIEQAYERYFQTFWFMAKNQIPCIGYEQHVFVEMCKSFPSDCSVQYSGDDRDWFAMGSKMLADATYNFSKPMQLVRGNDTVVEPIPFPDERVIHSSQA